jgi:hypothetical protein
MAATITVKQRTFAKLIAQGMPKTHAYEKVYGHNGGKKRTRQIAAQRAAAAPAVRAEVARWEEQIMPMPEMRIVKQEMLASMRWLAREAPSMPVRLAASKTLYDICEEREQRERKLLDKAPVNVETLLAELAELRDKKQPATIELEAVSEAESEAQAEGLEAQGDTQ